MAADLTPMISQVQATRGVLESATTYVNGSAARLQTALDAALANGATAAELAPVQAEVDGMKAQSDALAAAIVANP